MTGLAHALQIDLCFRYTPRELKDVTLARLAGSDTPADNPTQT